MSDHYFSATPKVASQRKTIQFHVRDHVFELTTDAGVFSKAGLDFGTRLLLESVYLPAGAHAVDLGCGYGVIGRVLSEVYPGSNWVMVDVNERAVELARENTKAVESRVRVVQADGLKGLGASFDAVVLNPPIRAGKAVIYRLFEESRDALRANGALWIVIQKKHGAESAKSKLEELFAKVERVERESGYHVYRCVRGTTCTEPGNAVKPS